MIVGNLDPPGVAVSPFKANPPLLIDTDAILAGAVSTQSLQTVGRRHAQILQSLCPVKHAQLTQRHLLDIRRQSARPLSCEYLLCFCILETLDHASSI